MGLNPVDTSNFIFERFSNYATTSLSINDESIDLQLKEILREETKFTKGPIIEATPAYVTGSTILELIEEGVLSSAFETFNSEGLPLNRKLYKHQETAIKKVCFNSRNVVVATGTGSGKTEAFIIPILNHLLKLKKNGTLGAGVQALLLYPMNALANDQMKRLRLVLENEPEITFGIYTGETEERYQNAYDKFKRMHQEEPLSNELISREQMKEAPPNILLTNYAMLEYLMLRPEDNVFFQGKFSNGWKFIVIDEAHTYTGSKGIEMSMLLSRLKNTIGLNKGETRCILTSASLGSGEEDFPKVADFAKKLFREEFTSDDIVESVKKDLLKGDVWGQPKLDLYKKTLEMIEKNNFIGLKELLKTSDIPELIIEQSYKENNKNDRWILYNILSGDKRINDTISILSEGPIDFKELAKMIFPNMKEASNYMAYLIDVCNYVRESESHSPLIPARYHYFIKALEGAFLAFADKPYIYLDRMNKVSISGEEFKAFEIGICTKCNTLYLVGEVIEDLDSGNSYLNQHENKYLNLGVDIEYFAVLKDEKYSYVANEDELLEDIKDSNPVSATFRLCTKCGAIKEHFLNEPCDCVNPNYLSLLKVKSKDKSVHKCGICSGMNPRGSIVRRFFLAEDAVSSVLATALYSKIPNKKKKYKKNENESSIFDFLDGEYENNISNINKQLLIFSDNRQSAAFFATYLDSSYKDIWIKSILTKVIENNSEDCINNIWSLKDYHNRIEAFLRENNLFNDTLESTVREIWKWIMGEFIMGGPNSLESMGYLNFSLNFDILRNTDILFKIPFLLDLGFERDELVQLYRYLVNQFRLYRAIEYPQYVDPFDVYFSPGNVQGGFIRVKEEKSSRSIKGYSIKSWVPANIHGLSKTIYTNGRVDYLSKVFKSKGMKIDKEEVIQILGKLFVLFTEGQSPFYEYVKTETIKGQGKIFKIDPKIFKVSPGIKNKDIKYYKCNKCKKNTTININNVCTSYRCDGELQLTNLEDNLRDNHYKKLFSDFKLEKMDVSEHTAQLKTEYAAEIQNKFINGDINVLSCSTTFELGVDVGELETVFMKNMPPTPANYAQRAGRAGRRLDSTAYALTYARLASHDFSNFKEPYKMISGTVKPPYFEITNEKIAKRHMYACALSGFWKENKDYFKTVEDFFILGSKSGPELFKEFLTQKPKELYNLIKKSIPKELHSVLKIDSWGWIEELYGENGIMSKVTNELEDDLRRLDEAKIEAIKLERFWDAAELKRVVNTILKRPLINYLSQKNLLPKYGFPVDVVNLEANFHTSEAKNIELSRDLQIAISEYAPGSQVVANGKLWTSRYVKKIRKKDLVRNKFYSCSCGYFKTEFFLSKDEIGSCPICGNTRIRTGEYIMPEFGFVTESKVEEPGKSRPERTYSSRKHFSGVGKVIDEKNFVIGGNVIKISAKSHGVLTIINNGRGRGFYICKTCGYGAVDKRPKEHKNSEGKKCRGILQLSSLGYDFETDIVEIDFQDVFQDIDTEEGFWESIMYSIIEGMSSALEIDRSDIDGTLYIKNSNSKSIILFDTVPGGAGHVKRLLNEGEFKKTLINALGKVTSCSCGGELRDISCYNCLRNYYNQYCHDKLKRIYAIEGLNAILNKQLVEAY